MKFIEIPNHEKFLINKKGNIYDSITNTIVLPFKHNGIWHVQIDGETLEIARLMLITFIGDLPGNVIYKYGYNEYSLSCIEYEIYISNYENSRLWINGVEFMDIPGYPNYLINRDGIIYSMLKMTLLKKTFNHNGYPTVALIDTNGHRSPRKVHRMVYLTYIGNLDKNKIVDHKNGKKWCSSVWNLEQISPRENVNRAYQIGLNPLSHWSDDQIHRICSLLEDNTPIANILTHMGLPSSSYRKVTELIYQLKNLGYFSEITRKYNISNYMSELNRKDRKLTPNDVRYIKKHLYLGDMTIKKLSDKFSCSSSAISKIRDGKTWKHVV